MCANLKVGEIGLGVPIRSCTDKHTGFIVIIMFKPPVPLFDATPKSPWIKPVDNGGWGRPSAPQEPYKPAWHQDESKKIAFGKQLAKGYKPIDAALIAFNDDMQGSLWAIQAWARDALVLETKENTENAVNLLDKDALSVKLLKFADEKANGSFIHESKDRLAALKLYAEIQGMMPKTGIDLSKNNFVNNEMKITFVEAEQEKKQDVKTIEHCELPDLENALDINLKLVG